MTDEPPNFVVEKMMLEAAAQKAEIERVREELKMTEIELREYQRLDGENGREIEQLRAALMWIDTFEPETTAAAEAKFGFSMVGWKRTDV